MKKIVNGGELTNADRPFLLENIRAKTSKVYVNVSDSTQLNKNLTFV